MQRELPLHQNVGMEVVYVEQGRLRWSVDGIPENVSTGQLFFTLPWQIHGSVRPREPGNQITFVQFKLDRLYTTPAKSFAFHPTLDIPNSDAKTISKTLCACRRHAWTATPQAIWLTRTLVCGLQEGRDILLLQGLLRSLMVELTDIVSGRVTAPETDQNVTVQRILDLARDMEDHCEEKWPLARLQKITRLGKSQLCDVFKKQTGDSPHVFLQRARITKAETLLCNTDLSVTDIAFDCGYSTLQLFCRTFKQLTNRTPTEARRAQKTTKPHHTMQFSEHDEAERLRRVKQHEWL